MYHVGPMRDNSCSLLARPLVKRDKTGSLELTTFLAKLMCKKIYLLEQTRNMCNDVFKECLKHVLFNCNNSRTYVQDMKLY